MSFDYLYSFWMTFNVNMVLFYNLRIGSLDYIPELRSYQKGPCYRGVLHYLH